MADLRLEQFDALAHPTHDPDVCHCQSIHRYLYRHDDVSIVQELYARRD